MRIFKSHPLLKLVNSYLIDSPQPSNISYWWNFGSLLAFSLVIQIATGVVLAMFNIHDMTINFLPYLAWIPFILAISVKLNEICFANYSIEDIKVPRGDFGSKKKTWLRGGG